MALHSLSYPCDLTEIGRAYWLPKRSEITSRLLRLTPAQAHIYVQQRSATEHPSAYSSDKHSLSAFQPALFEGSGKCQKNRSGRSIAVLANGHDAFILWHADLFADRFDKPGVRLMWHQVIDLAPIDAVGRIVKPG